MEIIFQKIVTTRVDHTCIGCARKIPKGNRMEIITSKDGGDISKDYWCQVCQEYWNKYMDYGDLIGLGDLKDGSSWEELRKEMEDE
jgi:hypothetical protein